MTNFQFFSSGTGIEILKEHLKPEVMEVMKRQASAPSFTELLDEFFVKELNPVGGRLLTGGKLPAVNICESTDKFMLELAVPGWEKSDFAMEVTPENQLVISAETVRQEEQKDEQNDRRYTVREFSRNSFRRSFNLPDSVNSEEIDAAYDQGVLKVVLPKKPEALPKPARQIEIR